MKTRATFSHVDWIDPTLLPRFEYGAITKDQRTILIGYLDVSQLPTVTEFEKTLPQSNPRARSESPRQKALRGWLREIVSRTLGPFVSSPASPG